MELYKLKITPQNWHTFKGQLDAATHDELRIGDVVVRCANCNSVFNAVYVGDGHCPCGDHPFVSKKIHTGKIRLKTRARKKGGKWRSSSINDNEIAHRSAFPLQLRWEMPRFRVPWQTLRMNPRIVARVYGFVHSLCYYGLSVVLGMAVALLLSQGGLGGVVYLAERWGKQLSAAWSGFLSPLRTVAQWSSRVISQYMPGHFTALLQHMRYGAQLLVNQPGSFFEAIFH